MISNRDDVDEDEALKSPTHVGRQAVRAAASAWGQQISTMAAGLILTPLLIREVGASRYGAGVFAWPYSATWGCWIWAWGRPLPSKAPVFGAAEMQQRSLASLQPHMASTGV